MEVFPMETQYFKAYSHALGKDMECKVYGHARTVTSMILKAST